MLTWNIFVIIMSVNSLTLVNVNSSSNENPDTPRPGRIRGRRSVLRGSGSGSVNPSDGASASGTTGERRARRRYEPNIGHVDIFNPQTGHIYNWPYNQDNDFEAGSYQYCCYAQIRLFCDNDFRQLNSEHCLKRAILYFKSNLKIVIEGVRYNLMHVVYNFFSTFPMNTGKFRLPVDHCQYIATKEIERRNTVEELNLNRRQKKIEIENYADYCMNNLGDYQMLVKRPGYVHPDSFDAAASESRIEIVKYAMLNKSVDDYQPNTFQRVYLEAIAEKPAAVDDDHTPQNYCLNEANNVDIP